MPVPQPPRSGSAAALTRALEDAADRAVLAPSVHNTQPWRLLLRQDRLEFHADRSRQLVVLDPRGRALTQSVGAALLNARTAVAAAGLAVAVDRLPDRDDPDLLAVLRPRPGPADETLARLDPAAPLRRTNRRRHGAERVPDPLLRLLTRVAAEEDTLLVPVDRPEHLDLLGRLVRIADRFQNGDPTHRAELRRWTNRGKGAGDGVPPTVVPPVDGRQHDPLPLRDFDTAGLGSLPPEIGSGFEQTVVLLAGRDDDAVAWLRAGEALERVLLELATRGWVADPLSQVVEVPVTRTQLRAALVWDGHPLSVLRIGRADVTDATPRRCRDDVVGGNGRPPWSPGRRAARPGAGTPRRPDACSL